MQIAWRCQKCFRYLSHIEVTLKGNEVTQRTICPRCKSENKITLSTHGVVSSCAFSIKYNSNITPANKPQAIDTRKIHLERIGSDKSLNTEITITRTKKAN